MKNKKMLRIRISGIVIAILVLLLVIYGCFVQIRENLENEMQKTLRDVAAQNVIAVEKEVTDKYYLLQGVSREITELPDKPKQVLTNLQAFVDVYGFKRIGIVYPNGVAYTTDGYIQNIAFRDFVKQGLSGKSMITDALEDAIGDTPERINVISVPIYAKDSSGVIGVLFATYRTEQFQTSLNVESFDGLGYSYIIQKDGNIIVASEEAPLHGQTNSFTNIMAYDEGNPQALEKMITDVQTGKSGTVHYQYYGARDAYYTPLTIMDGDVEWYIITAVPSQVLKNRLEPVMKIVIALLIFIVAVAALSIFLYIYSYRKAQKELLRLAYEDPITKGDNFVCFKEKLARKNMVSGYLIAMDLNEFKIINNTCGVSTGDEALRRMWEIFQEGISSEELVSRVNADRFILFLSEDTKENIEKRILQFSVEISALSEELNVPRIHPSFGIYHLTNVETIENAYSHAIQAKHLVKGLRDRILAFYDEVDSEQVIQNRKMEDAFDDAIKEQQFEVWYQPKYSVDGSSVVGAEALVRWRTPEGSYLSPGKFIPLFEKNGMISTLDEYVFTEVCRQQKEWETTGRRMIPVSVNISRASLYYANIVERYQNILKEFELDPTYVQLEITESATIDNSNISRLISDFHDAGFWLLLDDFGNGYSSLATLNVMHFDTLKLDKSLIDYIGDKNGETLLYYVTKLAQNLGFLVTAEGVETEEQVAFLQEVECNDIQGYYFSKPLPLSDYEKLLSASGAS
ncbi:MAG: GGDEF domain-containing protein [Clostridiales bacterium]|nr:GGDEF domain-containing protein [Clostridiales bacterium]